MVVVDANVLLYAVDRDTARHETSRHWLDATLAGVETVGFAWLVLLAFVRLATNSTVFPQPLGVDDAFAQVDRWLAAPAAVTVSPTTRHVAILRGLLGAVGAAGNLASDAHLAALAVEHSATIVSFDRDFARFDGVAHRLPG